MLRDDRNEPLQTTQDRTVDNDGPGRGLVCGSLAVLGGAVLQLEPFGELEVELDGGALEGPIESVFDGDIDLGSVEGTIAWVDLPLAWVLFLEGLFELLEVK